MNDPESAFGIYSVSVFRCDKSDIIDDYSCLTEYQLQVCKDQYYVNIINNKGDTKAAEQSIWLANKLQPLLKDNSFEIIDFIKDLPVDKDITKATLIKGELGLFNGAYDWYDILQGIENYTGLVLENNEDSDVILKFNDHISQAQFIEKQGLRTHPEIYQEVSIDQNTNLAVLSDRVVIIHRKR